MSQFKKKLSAFTAMLALVSFSGTALAVTSADVISQTSNAEVIDTSDTRTDINVTGGVAGAVAQIDFTSFNVAANEQVNYGFSAHSQTMINRVLGGTESTILGKITSSTIANSSYIDYASTGKVILINPAGVLFGAGSTVDLNSFTVSTFDFNGAKNLKGLSESDIEEYQTNVLNKLSPVASVNGESRSYADITFDSNYQTAFSDAGLSFSGSTITLNGATFDDLDSTTNQNKSLNFVADNIVYKDSLIRVGSNLNYGSYDQSFGNVRIITADGVTFRYVANGYSSDYEIADDTKTDVQRNITIDNSGLDEDETAILSGDIRIENISQTSGSNISIKNTLIKATKLVSGENGNIMIVGSNDVSIADSRLDTINTTATLSDDTEEDTVANKGGEIYVAAGNDLTIENSVIMSADSTNETSTTAGAVRLTSTNGDVTIDNVRLLAGGLANATADGNVSISDSLVEGSEINISGQSGVTITDAVISSLSDINILSSDDDGNVTGDIVISSTPVDGQNQTLIRAADDLSIEGANTTLDNASVAYDNIYFYGNNTQGTNNVTFKNDTTFSQKTESGYLTKAISLETNGDIILDNATMKTASYSLDLTRVDSDDSTSDLVDDGTADAITYSFEITPINATNLTLTSTEGSVNVVNGSDISATNVTLNAAEDVTISDSALTTSADIVVDAVENATISNSVLTAGGDTAVTAQSGALRLLSSELSSTGDAVLTSYDTLTLGDSDEDASIDTASEISADTITIKSSNGDINVEKTTMPVLKYISRLVLNAKGSNNITSADSLKSVNVDYIAGTANNFTAAGDIQFVDSTLTSQENNITTTTAGDVIMNDLTINSATDNAEDTVTTINAVGNITTKDVTKSVASDREAASYTGLQSVTTDESGTETDGLALDISNTKFIATTEVTKDASNPTNGSITLDIKNASNTSAGIELVAQNTEWDEDSSESEGPEVTVDALDGELAISKIITDKLTLDSNDKFYAASVDLTESQLENLPEGTASQGYIEVRDQGGFNLDSATGYTPVPDTFTYTGNYDEEVISVVESDEVVTAETEDDEYYYTEYTKTTTTTTNDKKHTIEFDNDGNPSSFILVYDKTDVTSVDTTRTVATAKYDPAPEVPDPGLDIDADSVSSYIDQTTLPRAQVEVSETSTVADSTADQTASIMSAAAKVDLSDTASVLSTDDSKDEDTTED